MKPAGGLLHGLHLQTEDPLASALRKTRAPKLRRRALKARSTEKRASRPPPGRRRSPAKRRIRRAEVPCHKLHSRLLLFEPLSQTFWILQASWDHKRPFSQLQTSLYDVPAEKTIPHRPRRKFSQESHLLRLRDWERNFRGKLFCT